MRTVFLAFICICLSRMVRSVSAISTRATSPTDDVVPAPKRGKKTELPVVASVDIHVPSYTSYRVITDPVSGLPLTAMLNQTNLALNNNKFFFIQGLKRLDGKGFACFRRWGRVGYDGNIEVKPADSLEETTKLFTEKFEAKTLNQWNSTVFNKFKSHSGKYTLLPLESLSHTVTDADGKKAAVQIVKVQYEATKLESQIFDLIKLISSREMFESELKIAGLDLTRMPLGQISRKMISDGYTILKQIEKQLMRPGGARREELAELSGRFYTVIPHNFGFNKAVSFIINTLEKLREKLDVLETLSGISDSVKMEDNTPTVEEKVKLRPNPVDEQYKYLSHKLELLKPDSKEYKLIAKYKENTHGETHGIVTKILNIYKISSGGKPKKSSSKKRPDGTKMLLWHGSRLTNWMSILAHGLKIAPPEAPHTGYMFGKGVYTADCFSKSANYCFVSDRSRGSQRTGLVTLCEVDLGKSNELLEADYDAEDKLKSTGCHSTKGVGEWFPEPSGFETFEDLTVPCGKLISREPAKPKPVAGRSSHRIASQSTNGLLYNEYIVYDTKRVKMRYLVELEFGR